MLGMWRQGDSGSSMTSQPSLVSKLQVQWEAWFQTNKVKAGEGNTISWPLAFTSVYKGECICTPYAHKRTHKVHFCFAVSRHLYLLQATVALKPARPKEWQTKGSRAQKLSKEGLGVSSISEGTQASRVPPGQGPWRAGSIESSWAVLRH